MQQQEAKQTFRRKDASRRGEKKSPRVKVKMERRKSGNCRERRCDNRDGGLAGEGAEANGGSEDREKSEMEERAQLRPGGSESVSRREERRGSGDTEKAK